MMNSLLMMTGRRTPRRLAHGAMLAAAVLLMSAAHANQALSAESSRSDPSDQLYASPSQVRMVQEKLREQGRKPGVEGTWDRATAAAARDYQEANGLAPTGQLDTSLLSALEIGDVLAGKESSGLLDGLLQSKGEPTGQGGRGAPLYVSPVHIAQIQHLLHEEGHYSGAIDGVWGSGTAQAVNEYRKANGLEASSGLDIALLRALNKSDSAVPKLEPRATSRTAGVPLRAGPPAIRALQRELAQSGHEAGAVDGVWGENTRQALREFQREHDLEPTGTLTLPTLAALGINVAQKGQDIAARTRSEDAMDSEQDSDAVATTR